MIYFQIEISILPRIVAPLLAGLLLTAAFHGSAVATPAASARAVYVIADHDGYGVLECLTQGKECGKILADSWCESHGHGPALAFGRAEDITGSTPASSPRARPASEAASVTCGD
jgi:hypothetical protein